MPIRQYQYHYVYDSIGEIVEKHEIDSNSKYVEVIRYGMYDESGRVLKTSATLFTKEQYNAGCYRGVEPDGIGITYTTEYTYTDSPVVLTCTEGLTTLEIQGVAGESIWYAILERAKLEYDEEGRLVRAEKNEGIVFELIYI